MPIQTTTLAALSGGDAPQLDWLVLFGNSDEAADAFGDAFADWRGRVAGDDDWPTDLAATLTTHRAPGVPAKRLLVVGLGEDPPSLADLDRAFMTAARAVSRTASATAAFALPGGLAERAGVSEERLAERLATACVVGAVGQAFHKEDNGRSPLAEARLAGFANETAAEEGIRRGRILGEAINRTRELVNRPPNDIFPDTFAETAATLAEQCGLEYRSLDEDELFDEGMNAMLAVGVGSIHEPRLVELRYRGNPGAGEDAPELAIVGKGVTFDSGGLSLKPTEGMLTMKCDMAGAATVVGAMLAIAKLKLPVNVVGYAGLVENMVDGASFKLGDILHSHSGRTIEVLNTDAEGRLVLADVLSYAVDAGATHLVDLATLTGACVVALGTEIVGVFGNEAGWTEEIFAAADAEGELVWRLPMHDHFADLLKSDVADTKNVGPRWGGATTAAKFLEQFVAGRPWVHLDIAGPAFADSNTPHREGGGTGVMVRSLVELASRFGEKTASDRSQDSATANE